MEPLHGAGGSRVLARRVVLSQIPECEGPVAHGTRLGTEIKKGRSCSENGAIWEK